MAEIINLRRARKEKARTEAARVAEENRARFGRTKPEKIRQKAEAERQKADLDGKRLER